MDKAFSAMENCTLVRPRGGKGTSNTNDEIYRSIGSKDVRGVWYLSSNLVVCRWRRKVCDRNFRKTERNGQCDRMTNVLGA